MYSSLSLAKKVIMNEEELEVLKSQIGNIIFSNIKDNLKKGNYKNNFFRA
jgi:hypothetical protein